MFDPGNLGVYTEKFGVDDTEKVIDENIDFEFSLSFYIFDFNLNQRSGCIDFVDLSFPSGFFIVFIEFDFEEFGKVLKEIVFVHIAVGQNCDIKISISSSKTTD